MFRLKGTVHILEALTKAIESHQDPQEHWHHWCHWYQSVCIYDAINFNIVASHIHSTATSWRNYAITDMTSFGWCQLLFTAVPCVYVRFANQVKPTRQCYFQPCLDLLWISDRWIEGQVCCAVIISITEICDERLLDIEDST